jgi:hypothetical protein
LPVDTDQRPWRLEPPPHDLAVRIAQRFGVLVPSGTGRPGCSTSKDSKKAPVALAARPQDRSAGGGVGWTSRFTGSSGETPNSPR